MSVDRPVILIFTRYYLPGYKAGGPIRSVANLVDALGCEFDFRIVTSDRDVTDGEAYPGIDAPDKWRSVGKAQVLYLPPGGKGFFQIARILRETPCDIIYLNSFFDFIFTVQPLVARRLGLTPRTRCVIAPRGEFSLGALDLKRWKKMPFQLAARLAGLYRGLTWHASSEYEKPDIRRVMKGRARNIHVAQNISTASGHGRGEGPCPRAHDKRLRVCFLSRISPKKNLHFALEVLSKVGVPVIFSIYGPKEDGYWKDYCLPEIAALPSHVVAVDGGSVEHSRVLEILSRQDLFFLPTLGENYGHVIAEALIAGVPLLLSDRTLWRDLEAEGVGADFPLECPEKFVRFIEDLSRQSDARCIEMRRRVKEKSLRLGGGAREVEAYREMFRPQSS